MQGQPKWLRYPALAHFLGVDPQLIFFLHVRLSQLGCFRRKKKKKKTDKNLNGWHICITVLPFGEVFNKMQLQSDKRDNIQMLNLCKSRTHCLLILPSLLNVFHIRIFKPFGEPPIHRTNPRPHTGATCVGLQAT